MKQPLIAVYDKKLGLYDAPFTVRHPGEAQRQFLDVCQQKDSRFGMHPEDYELYELGTYDMATGHVEHISPFKHLCNGVN